MRYLHFLGFCLIAGLIASACSQQSETTPVGNEPPGDSVDTAGAPTLDANTALASALTQAKSDDKNVFVHLGAPW
jgi:hypothetical protein